MEPESPFMVPVHAWGDRPAKGGSELEEGPRGAGKQKSAPGAIRGAARTHPPPRNALRFRRGLSRHDP